MGQLFNKFRVDSVMNMITIELRHKVRQIPNPNLGVVMNVIRYQERIQFKNDFDNIGDKVAVFPSIDRDDAVVIPSMMIVVEDLSQFLKPLVPIETILFFVNTTTATNSLIVKGDV